MALNLNLTRGMTVVLENPFDAADATAEIEKVWNTGCAACDEAHCNEDDAVAGLALVADTEGYEKKHIAAVRLYKNNEYIHLAPGDKVTLEVGSAEAAAYYAMIPQSEILKVTVEGAVVEDAPVEDDSTDEGENA